MDNREFETKVLNIDKADIIARLLKLGAKDHGEKLLRRNIYDIPSQGAEWIRLRTDGIKTTLTYKYKEIGNTAIGKTIEIEVEVSDFDKTTEIFSKASLNPIYYQESKTHVFTLDDLTFSIDTWPGIQPYLEIESTSTNKIQEGLKMLELEGKDVGDKDIKEIYQEQANIDMHSFSVLKF